MPRLTLNPKPFKERETVVLSAEILAVLDPHSSSQKLQNPRNPKALKPYVPLGSLGTLVSAFDIKKPG